MGHVSVPEPFIFLRRAGKVNWACLTGDLLTSQLFGHVKGSFTGATDTRPGLIEAADRGTLFLD
jgi:transcriptional regulator with GAF, ATPase, and Fis domain